MRILMDGSTLIGGGYSHLRQMMHELPPMLDGDECYLLVPPHILNRLKPELEERFAKQPELLKLIHWITYPEQGAGLPKLFWRSFLYIPFLLKKHRIDVLASLTGFGTWIRSCPELLLIRNTLFFCPTAKAQLEQRGIPEPFRIKFGYWTSIISIMMTNTAMFPTDNIKDMVNKVYNLKRKRTEVLHYGVNTEWFEREPDPDEEMPPILARIAAWKEEGYQILLHVSSYAFHKNVEVVLEALPKVLASGVKLKWVTTLDKNRAAPQYHEAFDALMKRAKELGLADTLIASGHIPHPQIPSLFKAADVFVFPSYTESFGQPMLEAMAASLPVVASDIAVCRELGQDAFAYFETFDADDCARVLTEVMQDPNRMKRMSAASSERIKAFSWHDYTRSFLRSLRDLVPR